MGGSGTGIGTRTRAGIVRAGRRLVVTATAVTAAVCLAALGLGVVPRPVGAAVTLDPAGRWGPLESWPLVAIHVALMGDGTVVSYGTRTTGGGSTGRFHYDVWTPGPSAAAGHRTLPNTTRTDIFCNVQVVEPSSGRLLMFGGDNFDGTANTNTSNPDIVLYDPATRALAQGPTMSRARWYGSAVTLHSGEIYVQGGLDGRDRPELWRDGATTLLPVDTSVVNWNYPRLFVQRDGSIFGIDNESRLFRVDRTLSKITVYGMLPVVGEIAAAQVQPGKLLVFGGTTNQSYLVDTTTATPIVTRSGDLSSARQYVNATVLADGRVLATGGSSTGKADGVINNSAELWDPRTGQWTRHGNGAVPRLYHSTALLLPDGRVLVAGDNSSGNNLNAELYAPSYLVAADGSTPPRPTITSVNATAFDPGAVVSMAVTTSDPIRRVTLLKAGTVTHTRSFEQQFVDLPFTVSGSTVTATLPADGTLTPGNYLLHVLDANGVPSVAKIVSVRPNVPKPVVVGPVGSSLFGSTRFDDRVAAGANVTGVRVWTGTSVNGIQLLTTAGALPVRGSTFGTATTITLGNGERFTSAFGHAGWGLFRLGFRTSTGRTVGPFGGSVRGTAFELAVPNGAALVGLSGSASPWQLSQLGLVTAVSNRWTPDGAGAAPGSNRITNGGFETPALAPNGWLMAAAGAVPGWRSTAPDGSIELWGSGSGRPGAGQVVELNSWGPYGLYQDVASSPGAVLTWEFWHRGRADDDTVQVGLGAPGGTLTTVATATTGPGTWTRLQGSYTVPAGQTTTRFQLTPLDPGSAGNLVDDVALTG